jgi:hypothetical protein
MGFMDYSILICYFESIADVKYLFSKAIADSALNHASVGEKGDFFKGKCPLSSLRA